MILDVKYLLSCLSCLNEFLTNFTWKQDFEDNTRCTVAAMLAWRSIETTKLRARNYYNLVEVIRGKSAISRSIGKFDAEYALSHSDFGRRIRAGYRSARAIDFSHKLARVISNGYRNFSRHSPLALVVTRTPSSFFADRYSRRGNTLHL